MAHAGSQLARHSACRCLATFLHNQNPSETGDQLHALDVMMVGYKMWQSFIRPLIMGNLRADSTHFQVSLCLMGIPPPHLCHRCHSNRGKMQREKIRQHTYTINIHTQLLQALPRHWAKLHNISGVPREGSATQMSAGNQRHRGQDCPHMGLLQSQPVLHHLNTKMEVNAGCYQK